MSLSDLGMHAFATLVGVFYQTKPAQTIFDLPFHDDADGIRNRHVAGFPCC
jgi:hypothetical protein